MFFDKCLIVSVSWDVKIGLWLVDGGELMFFIGYNVGVNKVVFIKDGCWLYLVLMDGFIILWDVVSWLEKWVVDCNGFGINVLKFGGFDVGLEIWLVYGF